MVAYTGVTYMELPEAFKDMRDDEGNRPVVELYSPMWGEGPAGFEWQIELESQLTAMGWRRCENVPACWRFVGEGSDCYLLTIVDDL